VVMGSPTEKERYDAARMLLDYGFSNYKSVPVVKKEAVVTVLPVEKGSPPELEVIAAENLSLLLPRDADESYTKEVQIFPLELPLKQYQKVGELTVRYGENEQTTVDLLVHEELQRAPVGAMFLRLLQRWLRFGR
ncbi:MAG: hypothetical protein WBL94_08335, partial [Dethiobacteria bacterium]